MIITGVGCGIRRKKGEVTLDVTYLPIIANKITEEDLEQLIKLPSESGFIPLSIEQLKDLSELNLPQLSEQAARLCQKNEHNDKKRYSETDFGIFLLFNKGNSIKSSEEAYFKLQMLSQRIIKPHELSLEGIFGHLMTVAWTNEGPILPEDVESERINRLLTQEPPLQVTHVDKFPYMINYYIPSGVRIASGSQVRLGAYLGEGTTVMPAGYINFNAGTEGNTMVEGRVSAGVYVSKDSDIGGGASIMGTLSGGNDVVITIGSKCLLGANSGTGISLGFGCTIAAGLYIYSGMKIALYNEKNKPVDKDNNKVEEGKNCVKAKVLSGRDNMLFIQDSKTGQVICKPNPKTIQLNKALHNN